jgi:hypothetical protein
MTLLGFLIAMITLIMMCSFSAGAIIYMPLAFYMSFHPGYTISERRIMFLTLFGSALLSALLARVLINQALWMYYFLEANEIRALPIALISSF